MPDVVVAATAAGPLIEEGPIRRFLNSDIQKTIDDAMAQLPADKRIAAIAHADLDGASVSIVARLGVQWTVAAGAFKKYKGAMGAEAIVRWSI